MGMISVASYTPGLASCKRANGFEGAPPSSIFVDVGKVGAEVDGSSRRAFWLALIVGLLPKFSSIGTSLRFTRRCIIGTSLQY